MSFFLSLIGLLVGISAFLYFLSIYDAGKRKIKNIAHGKNPKPDVNPDEIAYTNKQTRAPGERLCPLCLSGLSKYEALYATLVDDEGKKILIYGCKYCYKEDDNGDEIKKSAL